MTLRPITQISVDMMNWSDISNSQIIKNVKNFTFAMDLIKLKIDRNNTTTPIMTPIETDIFSSEV